VKMWVVAGRRINKCRCGGVRQWLAPLKRHQSHYPKVYLSMTKDEYLLSPYFEDSIPHASNEEHGSLLHRSEINAGISDTSIVNSCSCLLRQQIGSNMDYPRRPMGFGNQPQRLCHAGRSGHGSTSRRSCPTHKQVLRCPQALYNI
jgi:hypothetical protein